MGCFCKFPKSKVNHSPFSLYNIFLTICNCFKSICTKNGASFIFSFIMKILGPSLVIFLTLMVVSIYSLFVMFVLPKIFKHYSLMVIFTYNLKLQQNIILTFLNIYFTIVYIEFSFHYLFFAEHLIQLLLLCFYPPWKSTSFKPTDIECARTDRGNYRW